MRCSRCEHDLVECGCPEVDEALDNLLDSENEEIALYVAGVVHERRLRRTLEQEPLHEA